MANADQRRGGGRLTLRRVLALVVLVVAAWLVVAGQLSRVEAAPTTADPVSSPCHSPQGCSTAPGEPSTTPTPAATPIPTPTPTPAQPTVVPTPYGEAIVNAPPTGSLPSAVGNLTIVPDPNGSGSPLPLIALGVIVLLGSIAATCFFFFFRIR
jgi:hypothetical protein